MAKTPAPLENSNRKIEDLNSDKETSNGEFITTDRGLKINDDNNSLKAGKRGATLLEDFILREKITHFDHERIPERIVHARGSGAHGVFQVYESMAKYTKAGFLQDPSGVIMGKTPKDFIHAIAQHRFWERQKKDKVPA